VRIQFISSIDEHVATAKGGYDKLTVTFKNLDNGGKLEVKPIMSFVAPDVFNRLKDAKRDDLFNITTEKKPGSDGKSYWTWTEIHRDDGTAPEPVVTPASAPAGKTNTYAENNEINRERLAFDREKQPLIIRQSCLSSAVDLLKDHGKQPDVAKVLEVAAAFENYVWARGVAGITDDVPL